ncbi:hypothetical protein D3C85_1769560 [compost metagenome]
MAEHVVNAEYQRGCSALTPQLEVLAEEGCGTRHPLNASSDTSGFDYFLFDVVVNTFLKGVPKISDSHLKHS